MEKEGGNEIWCNETMYALGKELNRTWVFLPLKDLRLGREAGLSAV